MIKGLFGGTMPLLERTLDLTNVRQKLISSNIANEETPGYKAKDINFAQELASSMKGGSIGLKTTHQGHIAATSASASGAAIVESRVEGSGLDGNNVSLEGEMVKMAENSLKHEAILTILSRKFRAVKSVIESA